MLIYHPESRAYEEILSQRLQGLAIRSATQPEEALDFIEEAEIIFAWEISDDLLRKAKRLTWFASMGAGNEHLVNNPYLARVPIFTKTTVYGEMMAEYVFSYLLYFTREVGQYLEDQGQSRWDARKPERLKGKVLAVLGLGAVGREIAKRGKQFGMNVIGMKRTPGPVQNVDTVFRSDELEKLIPLADYLVVALPLTAETTHLLGEKQLALIKEGAVLFNVGRGKSIDEKALIERLKTGRMRAVLDVFQTEPLPKESELWTLGNVVVTPHVSGINLPLEICEEFIGNYMRWVRGEPLTGLVDREKGY